MHKTKILLLLGVALTVTACGGSNRHSNNAADTTTTSDGSTPGTSYMAYIQNMIADKTSDNTEPVDVEMVQVEQADNTEAINVM